MKNPAAVRHARTRNDNFRRWHFVDLFGLFGSEREPQAREIQNVVSFLCHVLYGFVKISLEFFVNRGELDRKRAVDEHRNFRYPSLLEKLVKMEKKILRPLHCECGDHKHAAG